VQEAARDGSSDQTKSEMPGSASSIRTVSAAYSIARLAALRQDRDRMVAQSAKSELSMAFDEF